MMGTGNGGRRGTSGVLLLPYLLSLLLSFSCNDSGLLPMGVEAFVGQPAAALLQQVGPSSAAACSRAKSALAMSAPPISSSPLKEREEEGAAATGVTPLNRSIVGFLKGGLSALYGDRHFARFYALETIARVPYFSYTSCLHLMETCGMVRRAEFMRTHFMETYNELHHLIIMEELGGDERFIDRFIAQHLAVGYFWLAVALYLTNPTNAYNLNQCVEEHAYSTYDSFLKTHGEELKLRPPTQTSLDYYLRDKLYVYNGWHNSEADFETLDRARPKIETLFDVFTAIRDDELEHVKTMVSMQGPGMNIFDKN